MYPKEFVKIPLLVEVIEQFQLWENRESSAYMHWKKDSYVLDNSRYPYEELKLWMKIDLYDKLPSIQIKFIHHEKECVRKYELNYRNATMVEKIMKRAIS